jgi:hypothetical protein
MRLDHAERTVARRAPTAMKHRDMERSKIPKMTTGLFSMGKIDHSEIFNWVE